MFLKYIIIIITLQKCPTVLLEPKSTTIDAVAPALSTLKSPVGGQTDCNGPRGEQKLSPELQFRLPFVDLELQNQRNLHITQEPERQHIFVLHGNEFYQVFIGRDEKRVSLIGMFVGSVGDMEPLGVQVTYWHNYLIIVIALEDYLEVYQIFQPIIEERANVGNSSDTVIPNFELIQQLTFPGKFQKIFLTHPEPNEVLLIVAVGFTKLYGKLRTLEWSNTYFNPVEELTVPPIHVLYLIGQHPKYLISGRVIRHQSKTILTVYQVQSPQMTLRSIQTITVNSLLVHAATYRGKNYLIACSSQQTKCNSFRMSEGQFQAHKNRPMNDMSFEKFIAGKHFLVGARLNEIRVFTNGLLNCYGSFISNDTEVTSIYAHTNAKDEDFIILNYVRPLHTLMRVVEVETDGGKLLGSMSSNSTDMDDNGVLHKHQHLFEEVIGKLRSFLLQRRTAMDVFRRVGSILIPKPTKAKMTQPVLVQAGKIGIINVVDSALRSPMQLLNRIADMKISLQRRRFVRSADASPNMTLAMPKNMKVRKLIVENLLYNNILLPGFHTDKLAQPLPVLHVRTPITTKTLRTNQLLLPRNVETARQASNSAAIQKVRELIVENINDMPWIEFYESLFLKNRDNKIEGNLVLQAQTKVMNLSTTFLNSLEVEKLFNLKQPQVVNSNITISGFLVSNLTAEKINNLDFATDIVFSGTDTLIETPVRMHQISINGDLLMENASGLRRSEPNVPLQQHYTGKVIINGSLTVNNLTRENAEKTIVLVNGDSFSVAHVKKTYLLENEPQNITTLVVFGNAKVTAPALTSDYLNGHPTLDHLLASHPMELDKPLLLVFMQARVNGDVICQAYSSKVLEMHKNSVRHGEVANITGTKIFTDSLTTDHLMALQLNDLSSDELVKKSELNQSVLFTGAKSFDSVVVNHGANVDEDLNCTYLNNLPLSELLNYDYYLDSLKVEQKLEVDNIVFQGLNGIAFDNIVKKFDVEDNKLVLRKDLIFDGNVEFNDNLTVNAINGIAWNEYRDNLVHIQDNATIEGPVRFLDELTITKMLNTSSINGVNMHEIFRNVLSKSRPQLITGTYNFDDLHASNLDVSVINDVPTSAFIDTRDKSPTVIEGDVIASKVSVMGNTMGSFVNHFQFETLPDRLEELPYKNWRNVVVLGNAVWNDSCSMDESQSEQLQYLYENAVRSSGNQVITGNVKLKRPFIRKMLTRTAFPKVVDFDFIARDCLFKNASSTTTQVVLSTKTFTKPLHIQRIKVNGSLNAKLLNNIDVLRLNASLYRVSSGLSIAGPLHFSAPPTIDHIKVGGFVNGINTSQIYRSTHVPLPPLKIRNLIVGNAVHIHDVNGMSLDYLLENRVTKDGEALEIFGILTFENLILNKEILLRSINGIPIDNLIFRQSRHLQAITGSKTINGTLTLAGPVHVLNLNGRDMVTSYQQSVFINQNYEFDNLTVDKVTFEKGFILSTEDMVGVPKDDEPSTEGENMDMIEHQLDQLLGATENITTNVKFTPHLAYLTHDPKVEIVWGKPNETIGITSTLHEISKVSPCERHLLHVQQAKLTDHFYLTNITSNLLRDFAHGVGVKVKNYCKSRYRKVRSKITITAGNLSKVFGMKKFIEQVKIFSPNEGEIFVLLHAVDLTTNRNEVRVLKIHNGEMKDWQSLTEGVGATRMQLHQFAERTLLIMSALVKHYPAITIYNFLPEQQKFSLVHTIEGDYDLYEVVALQSGAYHLILSCSQCQRVTIYEYEPLAESPYRIYQMLKLEVPINKLFTFSSGHGAGAESSYLLVVANEYYHLYKYSHIQGWRHFTYGYFAGLEIALPLVEDRPEGGQRFKMLLCAGTACGVVRAVGN